jgi:hypothetical protein
MLIYFLASFFALRTASPALYVGIVYLAMG